MKRILVLTVILSVWFVAKGQNATTSRNYISSTTYTAANGVSSIVDINYCDGLGYPVQKISVAASPVGGNSIVTPVYYDNMRRESRKYLPYTATTSSGAYISEALSGQVGFYNSLHGSEADGYSYTENIYEASPLDRVTGAYNVGSVYRTGIGIKSVFTYGANTAGEVMLFKVDNSGMLTRSGNYNANTLHKNTTTNEDGLETSTFTDFLGRVVLERTMGDKNTPFDTCYVYDDYGNLCYVLPPKLVELKTSTSSSLSDTDADMTALAYIYKYDSRNRCIEKRLPGAEPIYMVYDKGDRLVMTQDGNMRSNSARKWMYTEYDNLDRIVSQRIITGTSSRNTIQNSYNNASSTPYNPLASDFSTIAVLSENSYGK
ncbi:MAG: DUF6443 domain-containing protein [Alistipes sp.]|jgi:hypothetical protein|nr:DUF6443 domain-containing protein [Alistipes sp.]